MKHFSVIIPLYNKASSIKDTIESVLCQTYSNFELILVNDGSTDGSLSLVEQIKDPRIKILSTQNNGVAYARNLGVKESEYEYIAFLDADDYWYPTHLEEFSKLIHQFPKQRWYATAYEISHNDKLCLAIKTPLSSKGKHWKGLVDDYFENSIIDALAWTSAVCMQKTFFNELNGFDVKLKNMQDTDLWIKAALKSRLCFSNKVTARYQYDSLNHISKRKINEKTIMDFDKFESLAPNNINLKKYLDYNRYSVALRYKIAGEKQIFKTYYRKIDPRNLSQKQKTLLQLPGSLLSILLRSKEGLEKWGIRLRSSE